MAQKQVTTDTAIRKNNYSDKWVAIWTNGRKNCFNANSQVSEATARKRAKLMQEDYNKGLI